MSEVPADPSPRRPTISVATVGHHRHGKTTLTSAITRVLARRSSEQARVVSVAELDRAGGSPPLELVGDRLVQRAPQSGEAVGESVTVRAGEVRYATEHRSFVHLDSPGRRPWLKNAARAQARADALILVVSAPDSVQAQTREHLLLARALGVGQLVVFLNKCDLVQDGEWLDMVEHDVRELLGLHGFDGDTTRIVRGAALPVCRGETAWDQAIVDLVEALEVEVHVPVRATGGPAMMHIDRVYSRREGREGLLVAGRVLRGEVRRGAPLELRGVVADGWAIVGDLEVGPGRKAERAAAGEFAGLLLTRPGSGLATLEVRSGQTLLGESRPATRAFTARIELLATEHDGRRTPVRGGHRASLLFGTSVMTGRIELTQTVVIEPGQVGEARVELLAPVYLEPGMRFLLRDGNQAALIRGQAPRWSGSAGLGEVLAIEPVTR